MRSRTPGAAGEGHPADVAREAAGEAAELVLQRWEQLRVAGHLDSPVLEHERAPVRWHVGIIAAGVALAGLGVVGIMAS
jgi:hypothetical protein